jgi:hypothetical protein
LTIGEILRPGTVLSIGLLLLIILGAAVMQLFVLAK